MNVLASALTDAMTGSRCDLMIFDRGSDRWLRYPWPEVYSRAANVVARVSNDDNSAGRAVGVVGEADVNVVSAMMGGLLAGTGVSILPGVVRGAEPGRWAEATLRRFADIGVGTVFSTGAELDVLRASDSPVTVLDAATAGQGGDAETATSVDAGVAAVLQGTAGSTGLPRTALLSPQAMHANLRGLTQRLSIDASADVGCSWLPLYHDMGLMMLLSGAVTGAPFWLAPTAAFTAAPFRWLSWLSESRATITAGPNFAYNLIGRYARRVSDVDLGNVRVAINGGEPVDCAGLARFTDAMAPFGFPAVAAAPAYGLAEAACAVTMPAPGVGLRVDEPGTAGSSTRHAVLGSPIPGMQVRIASPRDGIDEDNGDVGEILIRGLSMMTGYHGEAALDEQSWFPTGDLGYLTDDGLVVCGRVKELISLAGRNIFPAEVEQVAAQVTGVRAGAVVAVGTGDGTARPGLVVAAEYRGRDEASARSEVTRRVAAVCGVVPASVVLLSPGSLPRTSSGKLRRLEVKRHLESVGT